MIKYFTFYELVRSTTAEAKGINNTPQEKDIIDNITELIETILDPLREAWGSAIIVSSGYRCPELNKEVGGSKTSSHMLGAAADIKPANGKKNEFFKFTKNWLLENNIKFDQIIDEYSGNLHWLHIGLRNNKGEQRKRVMEYKNVKYRNL